MFFSFQEIWIDTEKEVISLNYFFFLLCVFKNNVLYDKIKTNFDNKQKWGRVIMNLVKKCTTNEIKLLDNIGIKIEDRNYTVEEIRRYESTIEEFIMSHSTKNGDINKFINQYNGILNTLINIQ